MSIEHVRVCGACERECPGWANRCPVCGSLSLQYRVTFIPAAVVAPGSSSLASVSTKMTRKGGRHVRVTAAARDTKLRKTTLGTPLGGEPETRAV